MSSRRQPGESFEHFRKRRRIENQLDKERVRLGPLRGTGFWPEQIARARKLLAEDDGDA